MTPPLIRHLLVVLLLSAAGAAARDATVGACTRKEEFAKSQEQLDELIQQLTGASSPARKKKIASAIAKKHGARSIENLIRYREPDLALVLVKLLGNKHWPVRARAAYGLKMVGDTSVQTELLEALGDKEPCVRELAASALGHIGDASALKMLQKVKEKDPYVQATIEASIALLQAEEKPYASYAKGVTWEEKLVGPPGASRVEWAWTVKGASSFNDYDASPQDLPVAESFCYPVSWYRHSLFASYPRSSFGAGGNHAGEDCAWFREGCSYYAIADGVVRMVQGAGGDWGFLVVLEHLLPSGDYIVSVYGHAARDLLVRPGDRVVRGQKIATQGLSCSVENGGYGSHLHFGLGDGPFRRSGVHAKGDTVKVAGEDGAPIEGRILRFVYSAEHRNRYGFPRIEVVLDVGGGETAQVLLPEEEVQQEISWLQAYIKGCKGWLDPQTWLPEHVETK